MMKHVFFYIPILKQKCSWHTQSNRELDCEFPFQLRQAKYEINYLSGDVYEQFFFKLLNV